MDQENVLTEIRRMSMVFRQYISNVPEWQRREERAVIRAEMDEFLRSTFTALPPDTNPIPVACPRCNGKGTV